MIFRQTRIAQNTKVLVYHCLHEYSNSVIIKLYFVFLLETRRTRFHSFLNDRYFVNIKPRLVLTAPTYIKLIENMYVLQKCLKGVILGIDFISEYMAIFTHAVRFTIIILKRKKFSQLLDECHVLWDTCTENERYNVLFFVKKIQIGFRCYFIILTILTVMYAHTALSVTFPSLEPNSTQKIRRLPLRLVHIFKSKHKIILLYGNCAKDSLSEW